MPKFRVVEVGDIGTYMVPLPAGMLKATGWKDGDELAVSCVVTRKGVVDHLVVEKKE